ncbi:MAG: cysteine hydrolase [Candidatus Altiarchaeota archaeon]
MDKYTKPNLGSSCLLTIDVQNDFSLPGAVCEIKGTYDVIPNIVRLLEAYRLAGKPIIHVVRLYKGEGSNVDPCRRAKVEEGLNVVRPGSVGAELADALKPSPDVRLDADKLLEGRVQEIAENEFIIYKPRWGAFYNTPLEKKLRELDVDTLVFCGCNFPNCPRTSIYEASERDFRLVLIGDAVSQLYDRGVEELKRIGVEVLNTKEFLRML